MLFTYTQIIFSWIVHIFNWFFNTFCRESDSNIIWFIWTASIHFGWLKIFFETKYFVEYFVRHFIWEYRWNLQKTNQASDKQLLQTKYGEVTGVNPGEDMTKLSQKKRCWAVITGANSGLGPEYARQIAVQGYNLCLIV